MINFKNYVPIKQNYATMKRAIISFADSDKMELSKMLF